MTVTIYHNPACSTSRAALALLRQRGVQPVVVEYLKTPLDQARLRATVAEMAVAVRDVIRAKEPIYQALDLGRTGLTDAQLLDAVAAHPILLNRPIVATPLGTRLCRPAETLLDILPRPEDGAREAAGAG